jgi:hypothetical protein
MTSPVIAEQRVSGAAVVGADRLRNMRGVAGGRFPEDRARHRQFGSGGDLAPKGASGALDQIRLSRRRSRGRRKGVAGLSRGADRCRRSRPLSRRSRLYPARPRRRRRPPVRHEMRSGGAAAFVRFESAAGASITHRQNRGRYAMIRPRRPRAPRPGGSPSLGLRSARGCS